MSWMKRTVHLVRSHTIAAVMRSCRILVVAAEVDARRRRNFVMTKAQPPDCEEERRQEEFDLLGNCALAVFLVV